MLSNIVRPFHFSRENCFDRNEDTGAYVNVVGSSVQLLRNSRWAKQNLPSVRCVPQAATLQSVEQSFGLLQF